MLRIAHVSDLHVLAPAGVEWRRLLFNKRITGYANLLLKRSRAYRRDYLVAVLAAAAQAADQVVVTGDITNLSLEGEYLEARRLLDEVARAAEVSVVPGNHDIYLPQVHHDRRFPHHFASFERSDLPQFEVALPAGRFPFVKLRGPVALIGLSSAVPRPPFVSAGYLGHAQLHALTQLLAHPEVARRTPVIMVHHDPLDSRFGFEQWRSGLLDARALRHALQPIARGLLLFGHLHVRRRDQWITPSGALDVVCASGAALDHPSEQVRAGFNRYEIEADGRIAALDAHVLDSSGSGFHVVALTPGRSLR
ncbi:MAG TPA: metallophosphoesterase [Polyangiales bacterium]